MKLILKPEGFYLNKESGIFLEDGTKIEGVQEVEYSQSVDKMYGTLTLRIENVRLFKGMDATFFEIDELTNDRKAVKLRWHTEQE